MMQSRIVVAVWLIAAAAVIVSFPDYATLPAMVVTVMGMLELWELSGSSGLSGMSKGQRSGWPYWAYGGLFFFGIGMALFILSAKQSLAIWLLAGAVTTDIGAFLVGKGVTTVYRRFGRKPAALARKVSPNKTWWGAVGGAVASWATMVLLMRPLGLPLLSPSVAAMILVPITAILGDLLESWLKRYAGVKDSGRFLGSHGGILDRLDGIVAVFALPGTIALIAIHCTA
ncbi:MAG: phosphatidate cytidylyltransferase [Candidatus Saccharibacteria bacterium]|nr:phosphatidate cytidylyltransferase [Candidatus Saccharibacteria bacterium]